MQRQGNITTKNAIEKQGGRVNKSTIEELKPIIEMLVEEKLLEILGDPDRDLELRSEIKERLEKSSKGKQKNISIEEAADKLGLSL
jgi:hypothetical protein